jgi:hypothetical protein
MNEFALLAGFAARLVDLPSSPRAGVNGYIHRSDSYSLLVPGIGFEPTCQV